MILLTKFGVAIYLNLVNLNVWFDLSIVSFLKRPLAHLIVTSIHWFRRRALFHSRELYAWHEWLMRFWESLITASGDFHLFCMTFCLFLSHLLSQRKHRIIKNFFYKFNSVAYRYIYFYIKILVFEIPNNTAHLVIIVTHRQWKKLIHRINI